VNRRLEAAEGLCGMGAGSAFDVDASASGSETLRYARDPLNHAFNGRCASCHHWIWEAGHR